MNSIDLDSGDDAIPFTPYHFGPAFALGMLLLPFTSVTALLIGSVILDIEPFFVLFMGLPGPLHGFFHSYVGAAIAALILSPFMVVLYRPLSVILDLFDLRDNSSKIGILVSCFIGTFSHVFLDSFLYAEMNPFFPLVGNPFVGLIASNIIYQSCVILGVLGVFFFIVRLFLTSSEIENEPVFD